MTNSDSTDTYDTSQTHQGHAMLTGGGTMGALMRTFNWSVSPFGPVHDWPSSLRTIVNVMLNSQFPTIIFWGPELRMLYNDAYLPIMADRHPAALGCPARESWVEVWSIAGPMLEGVLASGQPTWSEDLLLPIVQNGVAGEHYFTFSYSPIRDETGQVCGVFCPVTETTERILRERQELTLRQEAEAARDQVTQILESISDSFVAFDAQWRITAINASGATAMHHRRDDLLGKVYWDTFPLTRETNLYTEFQRAMTQRIAAVFEYYYPPWQRWYDVRVYPAVDGGLAVFFRDITDRKRWEAILQESEERFRHMADHSPMMIWMTRADAFCTYLNQPWYDFTGQTPATGLGFGWLAAVHPDDAVVARERFLEANTQHEAIRLEYRLRRHDGVYRWMIDAAAPRISPNGEFLGYIGSVLDITDRKHAEVALTQHARDLARAHADLRQVAYVSAHDLQEPVRQVGLYTQFIAQRYDGTGELDMQEAVTFIVEGTKRMQAQFTDLMHYLEIDESHDKMIMTNCEILLQRVLVALREPITTSGATIAHAPLPSLAANASQLQVVFQELLDNAVKFRATVPPQVYVWAEREADDWRFAVRDNGIGIPPHSFGQLFGFFRKLHRRTEYPGTGMGLAICKKIIDRHGGKIWLDSTPGEGTTVYFTIPITTEPARERRLCHGSSDQK